MAAGLNTREQRLRKQAELQSLYSNLANLREQENSYITTQAAIPTRLTEQIDKVRIEIEAVENELSDLADESVATASHQAYWQAFAAEAAGDDEQAIRLYKSARGHVDANAAIRGLRYRGKYKKMGPAWGAITAAKPRTQFPFAVIVTLLAFSIILALALSYYLAQQNVSPAVAIEVTSTNSPTATPIPPTVLIPATATLTPLPTTQIVEPTITFTPEASEPEPVLVTATPTEAPTEIPTSNPSPTLRAAPSIVGPKNGLVWGDGAIVFEFEKLNLRDDELYCLNTLRGYDESLTENWSHLVDGRKAPSIPVEANVFRVARSQDIQCVSWSAYIGRGTCDNPVSENTETYIIGLPRPCVIEE